MNIRFLSYCILLSIVLFAPSAHAVSGEVSGNWSLAQSPVIIDGDTTISADTSLAIAPGVAILFTGPYTFTVSGTLTAIGTMSQPILFSRADATDASRWHGIRFENAEDDSLMEYCIIEQVYKHDPDYQNVWGGGVHINGCSPTIRYCTIRDNYNRNDNRNGAGGAVFVYGGSTSLIEYNRLATNETDSGGAIYVGGESWPIIRHNIIENNLAHSSGGGIYVAAWAEATIEANIIRNNTAYYWGGGGLTLWNNTCSGGRCMDVFNNIIYQNKALQPGGWGFGNGGGIYCRYNRSNQFNNTIIANHSDGEGGGIYVLNQGNTYPDITNTLVWANSATEGSQISLEVIESGTNTYYSAANVTYSNIEGGWTGDGNIAELPLFANASAGDFHLLPGSGGIDTGDNNVTNLPPLDFGFRDRILDGVGDGIAIVDIGAFELDPGAPLTGDIDGNNRIDLKDTILLLQLATGQDINISGDITGIDGNGDGRIGLAEAIFTLHYLLIFPPAL